MGRIRFGVRIPVTGPVSSREHLVDAALEAERLGFDAVFIGDHIAPGGKDAFERHKVSPPGGGSWREPSNTLDPNQFEMIAGLAYIAGRTSQIELGVGVTPLPLRDPIVLAKQIATLDNLSGGRFIFGVGVANKTDVEEFRTLKVPFLPYAERYEQAGEFIAAMRAVWEQPTAAFHGRHVDFEDLTIYPKPARRVPVWLGAGTLAGGPDHPPVRFTLDHADGLMFPYLISPEATGEMIRAFGETARAAGRDLAGFDWCCQRKLAIGRTPEEAREAVSWLARDQANMWKYTGFMQGLGDSGAQQHIANVPAGTPDEIRALLAAYADAGSNWFDIFFIHRTFDALIDEMRLFADEVIPAFN
jgi:alkanesulfonate monooxygenase SsuD/methylene tetrahydromethanopterin reductase-like flavin-dependent oxidoreductase (luciferase family)